MPIALRGQGASAPPVVMNAPAPLWRWRPDALLAAAVILPLVILGACAWIAWTDAWRSTERELASDADAVAEYASRVLEGHRLAGEFANHLLRGLSDDDIRERAAELHRELNTMLPSLAGVTTIAVLDREAEIMILANLFPVPPGIRVPDREWMRALSGPAAPPLHISALTTGRIDGNLFFSVSQRRTGAGNGRPEGVFDGVISVSVDPVRLSAGLAQISGEHDNVAALVRDDGAVLARSSGVPGLLPQIPEDSPLRTAARDGVARGSYMGRALGPEREVGESRLIAFRRVAGLPVYATVGRPTPMILARWRGVVASQLVIGLPAWFAFIALAWMLRAGQRALAAAMRSWSAGRGTHGRLAARRGAAARGPARRAHRHLGARPRHRGGRLVGRAIRPVRLEPGARRRHDLCALPRRGGSSR